MFLCLFVVRVFVLDLVYPGSAFGCTKLLRRSKALGPGLPVSRADQEKLRSAELFFVFCFVVVLILIFNCKIHMI